MANEALGCRAKVFILVDRPLKDLKSDIFGKVP
jgi:hypothetical protein